MGDAQDASSSRSQDDLLDCDIVMAGGVTSGIIYPGAVAMMARRYSFHSIGGTSVGAIAAAVTAAAEYGRRTKRNPGAFEQIAGMASSLGDAADDDHSRLFHLFTPEPATRPLLSLVTPLFGGGGYVRQIVRVLGAGLSAWQVSLPVFTVAVAGVAATIRLALEGHFLLAAASFVTAVCSALLIWLAMLALVLQRRWLPAWRRNGYGICTGLASPSWKARSGQAEFEGLTPWMHRVIQAAAGRGLDDAPLTFGDLWTASAASAGAIKPDLTAPRAIELAMIASDISRNRTAQLPFIETPSPIYVEISVLEAYFPAPVVKWIKEKKGKFEEGIKPAEGVIRLPNPQDLPVVFGARLSLSFPILLAALPLMTPDFAKRDAKGLAPLRRVWFSDGGLTSNFPIHFFDSPIPSRPTFCLNLVAFDAEAPDVVVTDAEEQDATDKSGGASRADKPIAQPRSKERTAAERPKVATSGDPQPNDDVWGFISMSKGNRFSPAPFTAFDTAPGTGLASFFETLLNTARFWSDNQMLIAPGVRDRVVNIALRDDEGGLNLDMSPQVIADLDLRGRAAGLLISARFDPDATHDPETGRINEEVFANHRWVRYRNFMAAFEDLSRRFARARRRSDAAATIRRESLLEAMMMGQSKERLGYPPPKASRAFYRMATDDLEQLALKMVAAARSDENNSFDRPFDLEKGRSRSGAAPRPKMRIRLRPLADNDPLAETAELPDPR